MDNLKHYGMPLTLMERKYIHKRIKEKVSLSEIGKELQRGRNTIIFEVRRNGGREKYNPIKAQEQAKIRNEAKLKTLSTSILETCKSPYQRLSVKIENIEMQLEIITETLKELKKCQKHK